MPNSIVFLSIPGLRGPDVERMPHLTALSAKGDRASLVPSFPCVTWPVQTNMLTGKRSSEHGVIANGFYWRERQEVEMWTAWNKTIAAPQVWDMLHEQSPDLTSAVWFPMLSKGCGADYVCMPAPVHNPDGSESLWCYTKPTDLYGELRDRLGHFPLQHFWGPMANILSSKWIGDSAVLVAERCRPNFFYLYLPHLDYAAQRDGPDSEAAMRALGELDAVIAALAAGMSAAYDGEISWLVASEYVIVPVDHVTYPNRVLRQAGLLKVRDDGEGEQLDLADSEAWCLVDHQFSHVYVRDGQRDVIDRVRAQFENTEGIAEVLVGGERGKYALDHPRSGEIVLISSPNSWQAYYWWLDDARAPVFARTVDIHRKPGYDPVELHVDRATKSIPLDAGLVKGSHGAPAREPQQQGILLSSAAGMLQQETFVDTDLAGVILAHYGS